MKFLCCNKLINIIFYAINKALIALNYILIRQADLLQIRLLQRISNICVDKYGTEGDSL